MPIFNTAFLFYRGPGEDFSDERRLAITVALTQDDQELVFGISEPACTIEAVRVNLIPPDAANQSIAYLKLYSLNLSLLTGKEDKETLIDLCGAGEIQQRTTVSGLTLNQKILGELYAVSSVDPSITVHFTPNVMLDSSRRLELRLSLEYLFSDAYLLARDLFLTNQEKLEQQVRALEAELKLMRAEQDVFTACKRSPLWRVFVFFNHYYEKLKTVGTVKACYRLIQPSWWKKKRQTDYERWRAANGYQNRSGR